MKKRICFVGFPENEPQATESMNKAMAAISGAWDCIFVADGAKALAAMAAEPFDAVVTNMQMTGMNGAELLQQVGQLHPKTLRFVLGDVADQELIINCIGGTHQFIAKPCKPQTIISTIQRGLALDAWLSTDQLRKLVPKLTRLPSLPSTYFGVLKQVESPNASVQSIGEVIARDPAVTARLLQMVNSAAFALSEKVTDPVHAVSLLGVETVKSLVLCLQVFSQSEQSKQTGLSFEQLWDHSFKVANIAREITLMENDDSRMANDAFTAGLLHDVGRIVMASNLPKEYASVVAAARKTSRSLNEEEAVQFGVTHAQVGAYLLGLWGMPAPLVEAAALHHAPSQASTQEFSLLTAVHVADVFAHEKDNPNGGLALPKLDIEHLNALGLADKVDEWRKVLAGEKPAVAKPKAAPAKAKAAAAPARTATSAAPTAAVASSGKSNKPVLVAAAVVAVAVIGAVVLMMGGSDSKDLQAQARTATPAPSPTPAAAPAQPARPATTTTRPETQIAAATTPAPTPAVTPKPAPAPTPIATPKAQAEAKPTPPTPPPPTRGFESVRVQAIFYRTQNPSVVINGKTLSSGERINGVEVISIGQTNVVLSYNNERRTFRVK